MNRYIKITLTDALSFFLFIIPIILLCMGLVPLIFGDITFKRSFSRTSVLSAQDSNFFLLSSLISLPFALFFYLRRLSFVNKIISFGKKTSGNVVDIKFSKDRGYVTYDYQVQSKTFKTTNRIMKTSTTQILSTSSKVTICYDDKNPQKAFIKEIYE